MSPIKLAIAVLASTSLLGAQRIVDAVKDFSVAVNPNGVWSYGATTSKGLNFARFSAKTSSTCLAKSSWGVNALSALSVGKNMGDKAGQVRQRHLPDGRTRDAPGRARRTRRAALDRAQGMDSFASRPSSQHSIARAATCA